MKSRTILAAALVLDALLSAGCSNRTKTNIVRKKCTAEFGGLDTVITLESPAEDQEITSLSANMHMPASFFGMDSISEETKNEKQELISIFSQGLGVPAENIEVDFGSDEMVVSIHLHSSEDIRTYLGIDEQGSLQLAEVAADMEETEMAACE